MSYYLAKTVPLAFDEAVSRVTAALQQEGFGVLTDIDVQATLKTKLGVDTPKYRILGACNPGFAHQALQLENKLGVLLPCNVIVREESPNQTEIAAINPVSSMERTGNPKLAVIAEEVRVRVQRAIVQL
jgi:uncharacterized protein (DUF302 family)